MKQNEKDRWEKPKITIYKKSIKYDFKKKDKTIKSNTILQRIKALDKTIRCYELNTYERSSKITSLVVQDMLTDLMHYCYRDTKVRCDDSKILIFDDILEKARASFWIETKEQARKKIK